jgi:hypothetical protein
MPERAMSLGFAYLGCGSALREVVVCLQASRVVPESDRFGTQNTHAFLRIKQIEGKKKERVER